MKDQIEREDTIVCDKRAEHADVCQKENKIGVLFDKITSSGIYQKFKSGKKLQIVAVAIIICVALVIYSSIAIKGDDNQVDSAVASSSTVEERLASILSSIEGVGDVEVMITEQEDNIVGVLVIANGAKDISVRLRLLDAASCALGVDRQIVNVYQGL